jgi:hypothetical protein
MELLTGDRYDEDFQKVFENSNKKIKIKEKIALTKYIDEMTIKTTEFNYEDTNIYSNFKEFSNFLLPMNIKNDKIETYIKCLCHIYLGNNIHSQIKSNNPY